MSLVTNKILTFAGYLVIALSIVASFANGLIFGFAVINRYCC